MLRLMMTKIILIIEHVSGVDYDDTVTKKGFHERNKTKNITFTKKKVVTITNFASGKME